MPAQEASFNHDTAVTLFARVVYSRSTFSVNCDVSLDPAGFNRKKSVPKKNQSF